MLLLKHHVLSYKPPAYCSMKLARAWTLPGIPIILDFYNDGTGTPALLRLNFSFSFFFFALRCFLYMACTERPGW